MNSSVRSITDLQRDILELTERAAALLRQAAVPLRGEKHYLQSAAQVEAERRKVAELELRMAIVAPMKAGKSTILNAVIGEELLPTRNTAMTSLPTSLVFDAGVKESTLELDPDVENLLQQAWRELAAVIGKKGLEQSLMAVSDPSLEPLVRRLGAGETLGVGARTTGALLIEAALSRLNDFVRLWSSFPPSDPLLQSLQRFQPPCLRIPPRDTIQSTGRLVIVDTPGPNDRNLHPHLLELAAQQIRETSLVLVALDYTQMNSEAADQQREAVRQISEIRGMNALFVLVNKIDQRTSKKDLQTEGVLQFVASQLGLQSAADQKRVFELSARKALRASIFLRERVSDDELCRKLESAQAVAQEYRPNDWEEALLESTSAEVRDWANKLWRKSGFDAFLVQALKSLLAEAAPRSLGSAMTVTRSHLKHLRDEAQIRRRSLDKEAGEIQTQLERIDSELRELEERRKALSGMLKHERDSLRRFVTRLSQEHQEKSRPMIQQFFLDRKGLSNWLKERAKVRPLQWLGSQLDKLQRNKKKHDFESEADARAFATHVITFVLAKAQPALNQTARDLDEAVTRSQQTLEDEIRKATRDVLERARERLKKSFDVELELPEVDLSTRSAEVEASSSVKYVKGRTETRIRYERRIYTLWLYLHEVEETVQHADQYIVSIDELESRVNGVIATQLGALCGEFESFLDKEFVPSVDLYFQQLSGYLGIYRETVAKSLKDGRESLEERKTLGKVLEQLLGEAQEQLSHAELLLRATAEVKS